MLECGIWGILTVETGIGSSYKKYMTNRLAWMYLLIAVLTEVAGITAMKLSDGFTHLEPSLLIFLFYTLSLGCLTLSLKKLDIGFAYAIWSALGTLLIFFVGIYFFQESLSLFKAMSLACIVVGVMGLRQA
jgi:small multidrug resistance pump